MLGARGLLRIDGRLHTVQHRAADRAVAILLSPTSFAAGRGSALLIRSTKDFAAPFAHCWSCAKVTACFIAGSRTSMSSRVPGERQVAMSGPAPRRSSLLVPLGSLGSRSEILEGNRYSQSRGKPRQWAASGDDIQLTIVAALWRIAELWLRRFFLSQQSDTLVASEPSGDIMASARTQCPDCASKLVVALDEVLYSSQADFFRCARCGHLWHVAKGQDGPASQALLGKGKLPRAS